MVSRHFEPIQNKQYTDFFGFKFKGFLLSLDVLRLNAQKYLNIGRIM